jgi:hypothetical protein
LWITGEIKTEQFGIAGIRGRLVGTGGYDFRWSFRVAFFVQCVWCALIFMIPVHLLFVQVVLVRLVIEAGIAMECFLQRRHAGRLDCPFLFVDIVRTEIIVPRRPRIVPSRPACASDSPDPRTKPVSTTFSIPNRVTLL